MAAGLIVAGGRGGDVATRVHGCADIVDSQARVGAPLVAPAGSQDVASDNDTRCQSMTRDVAAALNDLNRRFYAEQAASFSSTRRGSWAGWNRALEVAGIEHAPAAVVDVACGNMRFESYLAERFPGVPFHAIGVDNCPDLVAAGKDSQVRVGAESALSARLQNGARDLDLPNDAASSDAHRAGNASAFGASSGNVILSGARSAESKNLAGENAGPWVSSSFLNRDLVDSLFAGGSLGLPTGDLVACFGFMHHAPGTRNRRRMLAELFSAVAPGGVLVVSFWQFMTVESIAAQAASLTSSTLESLGYAERDLEPGDYILGWQNSPTARRYCHSFTVDEVHSLAKIALEDAGLAADFALDFFEADGRNNRLNCYLVAKRRTTP